MEMNIKLINRSAWIWTVLFVVPLSVGMLGCHHRAVSQDQQFRTLFDGFQLLLVDDLPQNMPVQNIDSSTMRNTHPSEQRLVPGRVYSFRKITKTSDETLGEKIFPERLATLGAHVTKAPHSSKDFIYPFIGGPLFLIEFEKDGHHGTMFNRVHTSVKPEEQWEEVIVAYR
jgi:hypothetical protein